MDQKVKDLLLAAKNEILFYRRENERMSIRLTAIDDMLGLLHGKPGVKSGGGDAIPDICWEIDQALKD